MSWWLYLSKTNPIIGNHSLLNKYGNWQTWKVADIWVSWSRHGFRLGRWREILLDTVRLWVCIYWECARWLKGKGLIGRSFEVDGIYVAEGNISQDLWFLVGNSGEIGALDFWLCNKKIFPYQRKRTEFFRIFIINVGYLS